MITLTAHSLALYAVIAFILLLVFAIVLYLFLKKYYTQKEQLYKLNIERKIREVERKNFELEKVNNIKTRLISIISHDIISPLRFMHLSGKNLINQEDTTVEEYAETLIEVINTSQELELLSANILNWIKYQNKNRKLVKENIHLHEIVEEVFSILRPLAKEKGIFLTNNIDQGDVIEQYFEPLKVILYNLVLNAINFMVGGHIHIVSKNLKTGLLIEVKDEGLGMTQQQIDNLLSEQTFISTVNSKGKRGNGLGFLIIKDLLKVTNGRFTISSAKNRGTKIKLFFPNK